MDFWGVDNSQMCHSNSLNHIAARNVILHVDISVKCEPNYCHFYRPFYMASPNLIGKLLRLYLFRCRQFPPKYKRRKLIHHSAWEASLKRVNLPSDIDFTTHPYNRYSEINGRVEAAEEKHVIRAKPFERIHLRPSDKIKCRGLSEAI